MTTGKSDTSPLNGPSSLGPAAIAGDERLRPVIQLAQACNFEPAHTYQVTRLALRLFDELQELHRLGSEERFWLHAGCLLHDIGWIEGWKNHHKASLRIILGTSMLPFNGRERLVIGSITRYHRKSLPQPEHDNYAALNAGDRQSVVILSSFLRLADGMDRSHQSLVQDLSCRVTDKKIAIRCKVQQPPQDEKTAVKGKCDLLKIAFKRKIEFIWRSQ